MREMEKPVFTGPAHHGIRSNRYQKPQLNWFVYIIISISLIFCSTLFAQWGVLAKPEYPTGAQIDPETMFNDSLRGQLLHFVTQMWTDHDFKFLLNFMVLSLIFIVLLLIINRFWICVAIFSSVIIVYAIANHFKVQLRNEPIIPADLNFISGGNTKQIVSFIPPNGISIAIGGVCGLVAIILFCILLQCTDGRKGLIRCSWRKPALMAKSNLKRIVTRFISLIVIAGFLFSFVYSLGNKNSWGQQLADGIADDPQIWNSIGDARSNGAPMAFLRLVHTNTMDKPHGYNKTTMLALSEKYQSEASRINRQRSTNLTDNTVIMILSESYSDPTRVPGISFNQDPMPNIRDIKSQTTSGLMLSPGYGGGTANIEYQALTGLSLANYDSSLSVPYQQLVPKQKWAPSFNQIWNAKRPADGSFALHTYYRNMYSRADDYRKFKFSKFWAMDGKYKLTDINPIDSSWYASDTSTYNAIVDKLGQYHDDSKQFVQVATMQNHSPYDNWYNDNEFKDADTSTGITDDERKNIETYAKGVSYTDSATADFLNKLDQMDRPITVIFYGDHLPGIYETAEKNPSNALALHETDYFIWSNAASASSHEKASQSNYTSSNYFMAQASEHMNAKVSPYLAFLTDMHAAVPAMSVPAASGNANEDNVYLDDNGKKMDIHKLPQSTRTLLEDYRFIQYDISVGKNYLRDTNFMDVPLK